MPVACNDPVHPNPFELVTPLEPIADHSRTVSSASRSSAATLGDVVSLEMVDHSIKALLNELTRDNFDLVSDQIIDWVNKSVNERSGCTLMRVTQLVYDKAVNDDSSSDIYALLCRKIMELIRHDVQDDGIKDRNGKPMAGPPQFRKYLLIRLQTAFEGHFLPEELEDVDAARTDHVDDCERVCCLNEESTTQRVKRAEVGLMRFIGQLFRLQMLTERIIHECIKKLLANVQDPKEEDLEQLCGLMKTVGEMLDTQKAHAYMDVYFARIKELKKRPSMSVRIALMLQVFELFVPYRHARCLLLGSGRR